MEQIGMLKNFPHPNPLVGKMMGRIMTISKMYK